MKSLSDVLAKGKTIRSIGFDDAPFDFKKGSLVNISGVICSGTRFEGMVWGTASKDGCDATDAMTNMLIGSKFHQQLHVVLIDGIAIGGFNIVDLPLLSERLNLPCIAVMRKQPDLPSINKALKNFNDYDVRSELIKRGGRIFESTPFVFQVAGCTEDEAAEVLNCVTDTGKVPEPLRLAHLIGAAIKTGESSSRA